MTAIFPVKAARAMWGGMSGDSPLIAACNKETTCFLGTRAAYLEAGTSAAVRLSKITQPSRLILAGDNLYSGIQVTDADKDDYNVNCPFVDPPPHSGKSNILFAGGSVRADSKLTPSEMQCSCDDPNAPFKNEDPSITTIMDRSGGDSGALKEFVLDLGGHETAMVIRDNPGNTLQRQHHDRQTSHCGTCPASPDRLPDITRSSNESQTS
jgi:prepilin-type processing-associated H-X9-DG protein